MSDVIARAESALRTHDWCRSRQLPHHFSRLIVADLLAELKAAQAELDRLRTQLPSPIEPTPLCPAGCDCSCCYGYDDHSCHHYAQPCNCGSTHA